MVQENTNTSRARPNEGAGQRLRRLSGRPEFLLIYLAFYFGVWVFVPVGSADIIAISLALIVFVPALFDAQRRPLPQQIYHIALFEFLAIALMGFVGGQGVFHIYACAQAGFQRPRKRALLIMAVLSLIYLAASFTQSLNPYMLFETAVMLFMGIIVGVSCMGNADMINEQEALERSWELDRELAAIAERERIARDLHDLLGHTLTMVSLKADIAKRLMDQDPDRAAREIEEIRDAARASLKDVRAAISDMYETTVDGELDRAGRALDAAGIAYEISGQSVPLSPAANRAAGLAIREAVTNIIRHSGAETVRIELSHADGALSVAVIDNGRGGAIEEGAGLTGLRQRLKEAGGRLDVAVEKGVRLTFTLPAMPTL